MSTNNINTADGSQATIRYMRETVWGEVPTTGNMQEGRLTNESFGVDRSTDQSEEITKSRQMSALITTNVQASGDLNGEFSYDTYDEFIAGALCNDWGSELDVTVTDCAIVDGEIRFPAVDPAHPFTNGMAINMAGWGNDANNGIAVITDIIEATDDTVVSYTILKIAHTLEDEAGPLPITMKGQAITNSSEDISFFIEKEFTDISKIFSFTGMTVNNFSVNLEAENKVGVSFTFMGANGDTPTATLNPGTVEDPNTNDIMVSGGQDRSILEGGTAIQLIKTLSLETTNNLRGKTAVGQVGNISVGKGRFSATGTISTYFEDRRIYDKYVKNQATSIIFTLTDKDTGTYLFNLPYVKFTESKVNASGGNDADIMVDGGYQALADPLTKKTLIITKIKK